MCLWDGFGIRAGSWGSSHKITLCINSLGLFFFWRKWNGGGGWSATSFCSCSVGVAYCKPQCNLWNEDLQCATLGWIGKKCDRKKQQKGWGGVAFDLILHFFLQYFKRHLYVYKGSFWVL